MTTGEAPDPVRGQVVKATIRLVKGTEPTEEPKKDELPKTISGKIQCNKL